MSHSTPPPDKFANFNIISTTYKKVGTHEIAVDIIVPKSIASGKRPVIARFHGGFLVSTAPHSYLLTHDTNPTTQVTGTSLFNDWFPAWLLQLASRHSAIIVSPNYRLMPEATGLDILDDLEDFWTWLHSTLPTFLSQQTAPIEPDLTRIITAGESAGGWLSVMLGLSHPDAIRAVTASYPMLDLHSRYYAEAYHKQLFDMPQFPPNTIPDFLSQLEPGAVTSSVPEVFSRAPVMFSMIQQGRYLDFLGKDRKLYPIDRLEDGDRLPSGGLVVTHGRDDSAVPAEGSEVFVNKVREVQPGLDVVLEIQPGEHGFDGATTLEDGWIANGLKGAVGAWLA
jgi:acetyl esterase/lipase